MDDIIVREAALDELPRIAKLKQQIHQVHVNGRPDLFIPIADLAPFMDTTAARNCGLVLAECQDAVVGYAIVQYVDRPANPYIRDRHYLHVEEFCVDENHHRMGIGAKLMEALKQLARKKGYPRIELDVWGFNEGARQFYEAVGMSAYRTFMEMNVEE